jgi:TolB protein
MNPTGTSQSATRRWRGRLVAGAVFVATVACVAGCMKMCGTGATARGPAANAEGGDGAGLAESNRPHADWQPGTPPNGEDQPKLVNVFGEMGGRPRGPVAPAGDAGFQQHTFADEGYDADVAVDPTGKWLAFASTRHSEHPDIYLQRVDGTSVTQLTSDAHNDAYPCFSPDGHQIAFSSTRAGNWQIFLMDLDGRNVVQVTSGPMQAVHPSFSPDGKRLAYMALGSRSGQWEIWTADLLTNEKRMVGYGLFPVWSPDRAANRIAFQRARQRGSRWFSLWTMELVDGEGRRPTEVAVSTRAAIVSPTWSPDGKRIAFGTVVPALTGNKPAQQDVWVVNADGTNKQRLTDGHGLNLQPCWASDGRIFFVSDRGGTECVWSVRADDPSHKTLTADAGEAKGKGENAHGNKADPFESADTRDVQH